MVPLRWLSAVDLSRTMYPSRDDDVANIVLCGLGAASALGSAVLFCSPDVQLETIVIDVCAILQHLGMTICLMSACCC
jgi:hypothetical protein